MWARLCGALLLGLVAAAHGRRLQAEAPVRVAALVWAGGAGGAGRRPGGGGSAAAGGPAHRRHCRTLATQAPEAAPSGAAAVPTELVVGFADKGCLSSMPAGVDWPFWPPGDAPPADATLAGTFTRVRPGGRRAGKCRWLAAPVERAGERALWQPALEPPATPTPRWAVQPATGHTAAANVTSRGPFPSRPL